MGENKNLDSSFARRHIGPRGKQMEDMLRVIGASSLDALIDQTIPPSIRLRGKFGLDAGRSEIAALQELHGIVKENRVLRSLLGMGYADTLVPGVIQRNIFENPGWYTQYTPYQAEIAQGRLEALLNFQTLVIDLTGLPIANSSLLDEATAAAEAMAMAFSIKGRDTQRAFFVSDRCHPQTIEVIQTRAQPLGITVLVGDHTRFDFKRSIFAALIQYPATDGGVSDYHAFFERVHHADAMTIAACDLLSLTLLKPPGEFGADVAIGTSQRLGVPLGYGGPHAAFFATKEEFKRQVPGRLVGVSKDVDGRPVIRLALQTREQHIRREKATSNICTAQVLLAVMASMYAVYHGPEGLRAIAERIREYALMLRAGLRALGFEVSAGAIFDTVRFETGSRSADSVLALAQTKGFNFRKLGTSQIAISLDEVTTAEEVQALVALLSEVRGAAGVKTLSEADLRTAISHEVAIPIEFRRSSNYLTHPVFHQYRSETEMLRYIFKLQGRDLSLAFSMIPLGSCTMKLNATAEMIPVTWPEISRMHPYAPAEQARGYRTMLDQLEKWLAEITGFAATSLQPNAGSQGEYAGLLVIRKYLESKGQGHRSVCLIPKSAHGTNPASAGMAGMQVVVVECDAQGNVDVADLRAKAQTHADQVAALMLTYPSTHGVFEESVSEICRIVHDVGGQVYMDGANMNAQVGLCRPGDFGPDVCHLNLHKTFAIPHGGGGPGMGPICVAKHLAPFLPAHPLTDHGAAMGPVSAAPYGSASILPISWMYIRMLGAEGVTDASRFAILNANYIARRLADHYPILYQGKSGFIAHECIFDLRPIKELTGIDVEDLAKRLMDYGFHAPTVSFPVAGTLMVEPTESESKPELDRFCDAMIAIREEIREIESGKMDRANNPLKNAPHTAEQVTRENWERPYSRQRAAFPLPYVKENKFWPPVGRVNNVLGDRQLICACPPMEDYV